MSIKKKNTEAAEEVVPVAEIVAYKGFNGNMTCRGFQYEMGKTFTHDGAVKHCESGFHACENPLDTFSYYAPGTSKFAIVKMSGAISKESDGDSKIASASITIEAELTIPVIVSKTIDWITALCKKDDTQHATGHRSASSATGDQSVSSATGDRSASSATGDQSVSSATGTRSASSATGNRSASSATGYQSVSSATGSQSASSATGSQSASSATGTRSASSATGSQSASSATGYQSVSSATGDQSASSATGTRSASSATGSQSASSATGDQSVSSATGSQSASSATGTNSVAMSIGPKGKAKASKDGAIVLCAHNDDGYLIHIRASKVGDNGIKPDVFYTLDEDGEFVEVTK